MSLTTVQNEFGMKVKNYHDGIVEIEMSSESLVDIRAIIDQVDIINQDLIQEARPSGHPMLTHERVVDLKQQLLTAHMVASENASGVVTVGLSETAIKDLSAIMAGANAVDDDFIRGGEPISHDQVEGLLDGITLIEHGLRPEEKIAAIEKEQGITVPRFKT